MTSLSLDPSPTPSPPPSAVGGASIRLFLFQLSGTGQHCLTGDPCGANIPCGFGGGTWTYLRPVDILPGEIRAGFDSAAVAQAINEDGYALVGWLYNAE